MKSFIVCLGLGNVKVEMACDYTQCALKSEVCGSYNRTKPKLSGCFVVSGLLESARDYLINLGPPHAHLEYEESFTERSLIENRLGKELNDADVICAHHRYVLGFSWIHPKRCQHPEHKVQPMQQKAARVRVAPIHLCKKISQQHGIIFPIGGVLCKTHLNEVYKVSQRADTVAEEENSNDSYHPPKTYVLSEANISTSSELYERMSSSLALSPLKFQVNKTAVSELAESSKHYLKRKYNRAKVAFKKKFCEAVAPGQHAEMMDILSGEESDKEEYVEIPAELQDLLKVYKFSDALAKIAILSLVNPEQYSKSYLMEVFLCTKYKIDIARQWRAKCQGLNLPMKQHQTRIKLDLTKCEHFIDFVFANGLLQDVAYGVTTLRFDNGIKQTIPHCILTAQFNHVISVYKQHCQNVEYEALSESSLWRILKALKPSQRKCLSGLDNTTADGLNGFFTLKSIVEEQTTDKELLSKLEKGKRYLKTRYASHCSESSNIATHCISLALSDPNNSKLASNACKAGHTDVCEECFNLINTLQSIMNLLGDLSDESVKSEKMYDADLAIKQILTWMKHIVRDVQQNKAKVNSISNLDNETAFWLRDYSQKVLPVKFREGQQDYFGKKGITLHVDVFFLKKDSELEKKVYFTVIFRSDQSMEDTLCIGENVLREFTSDHPNISKLYLKSDNAGSYHGNYYAEATSQICEAFGMKLLRIDYNEPQKGKDQCDRESATARNLMRAYVDSGHDILNADDVFEALQFRTGIRNGKVCVAEIDKGKVILSGTKIPNISIYHSFQIVVSKMQLWRYFQIGEGEDVPYNEVKFTSGLHVVKPFTVTNNGVIKSRTQTQNIRKDRTLCSLHFCKEVNCSETFDTLEDLEAHIMIGVHTEIRPETSMDKVRLSFSSRMQISSTAHVPISNTITVTTRNEKVSLLETFSKIGWALPTRSQFRFSLKQKEYLSNLFVTGEESGKKLSPNQVVKMMRSAMVKGSKLFSPLEYCTANQIQSLFSRWTSQIKKGKPIICPSQSEEFLVGEIQSEDPDDNSSVQELQAEIKEQLQHISDGNIKVGSWVAVSYKQNWYPGEVIEIFEEQIRVKCMVRVGHSHFKWPQEDDAIWYTCDQLLGSISPPFPVSSRAFGFANDDISRISSLFYEL